MGIRTANSQEHELGNAIKHSLIGWNRRVQPLQARAIADAAMAENGGEPVQVDFVMHQPKRTLGIAEHHSRWITLYEDGQTVGTLMHELAHQLPDGANHDIRWRGNFRKLLAWWNDNHHRFPYSLGMNGRGGGKSPFALNY